MIGEITTLAHEAWDDTVEARARISVTILTRAQLAEVLGSLRHNVIVELEFDSACICATNSHVEVEVRTLLAYAYSILGGVS